MSDLGKVTLTKTEFVANVVFDRPAARNAMTWKMYDELSVICKDLQNDAKLRAVVFRGAGGKSFIAGSDIGQFMDFKTGEDGVAYEAKMDMNIDNILDIPAPTLAVIEGWAVGGGLNIAGACDLRIATHGTKLGSPIARTVGNCLSMKNYAHAVAAFGEARTKKMIMLGEFLGAEEAEQCGFLLRAVESDALQNEVDAIVETLISNAPITLQTTKIALRRNRLSDPGDGADLIKKVYASNDFKLGVASFINKQKPDWSGN